MFFFYGILVKSQNPSYTTLVIFLSRYVSLKKTVANKLLNWTRGAETFNVITPNIHLQYFPAVVFVIQFILE